MHSIHTNRPLKLVAMAATATITAAMIAVGAPAASAADLIVQIPAGKDLFVAQNLGTINSGDKITWKNNDDHNVVSAQIPATATAFKSTILSGSAATFAQTPTVAGNYRYYCSLHSSAAKANAATQDAAEMVGQFTVGAPVVTPPAVPVVPPVVAEPVVPPVVAEPVVPPVVAEPVVPPVVAEPVVPPVVAEPVVPPVVAEPAVPPVVAEPVVVPVTPAANAVTVSGGFTGFTPKVIHVTAGVATTITYENIDNTKHDMTVSDLNFTIPAGPKARASKVLTATAAQVGSHPFICSVGSHADLMNGTLIVDPAGTVTPPPAPAPVVKAPVVTAPVVTAPVVTAPGKAALTISGGFAGFTPNVVHVTAGVATTITYKNTDNTPHDMTVSDLNFTIPAGKQATASKVLTPTAAQVGSHKFICSLPGHSTAMNGTLIVDPAGTTPPPVVAPAPIDASAPLAPAPVVTAPGKAALTVSGGFAGFTPKVVHVEAGVATTITYQNTDATPHDMTVSDLNFSIAAGPKASASKVLTPTAAQVGSHKFICSLPGHSTAMNGTLIVDPAGTKIAPGAATPVVAGAGQVSEIPSGGVASGGGSIAVSSNQSGLMTLGGGLFMVAFMSAMIARRRRVVLND